MPDNWKKSSDTPEAWKNKGSANSDPWANTRQAPTSAENKGKANHAASEVFNAIGGLAKKAKEYAGSEEAANKINAVKSKARSAAEGAGSAVSGVGSKLSEIKNKASDKISEHRNNEAVPDDNSSKQNIEDTFESESSIDEVSGYEENPESSAAAPVENYETNSDTTETIENVDTPKNTPPPKAYPKQNGFPRTQPNRPNPYTARDNRFDRINSAPPPVQSSPQPAYIVQEKKSPVIPILVIVLLIIILAFGILLGLFLSQKKEPNSKENNTFSSESEITNENAVITEAAATESEPQATVAATSAESTTQTTEPYVQKDVSKDEINQIYADIINETDFLVPHRGFIIDLNNDGVNELIVPDTDTMSYIIYYYENGTLSSQGFGSFMSLDNFGLYKVSGDNGTNYIYYRDDYSYKSMQGYFSLKDMTQLNIFIDYPENNGSFSADWTIDYNGTENYAKGNEPVDTFYGQPADCHTKLMSALTHYKFSISEDSKYTAIIGMYKDELLKNLSNTGSTAPKATASLSLEPQPIAGNGTKLLMKVNGNYYYYTYECFWDGEGQTNQLLTSGSSYDNSVIIEGGSTITKLTVIVIPYNEDDFAGDKVTINHTGPWSYVPVQKSGQINAPGGGPINGYATSYILNGGSVSYERTDLMDKWHVTAVNLCSYQGTIWYELYDSDDGDYYGWVDSDHIDFY